MHQQDVVEESLKVKHMMVAGGQLQGVAGGGVEEGVEGEGGGGGKK